MRTFNLRCLGINFSFKSECSILKMQSWEVQSSNLSHLKAFVANWNRNNMLLGELDQVKLGQFIYIFDHINLFRCLENFNTNLVLDT